MGDLELKLSLNICSSKSFPRRQRLLWTPLFFRPFLWQDVSYLAPFARCFHCGRTILPPLNCLLSSYGSLDSPGLLMYYKTPHRIQSCLLKGYTVFLIPLFYCTKSRRADNCQSIHKPIHSGRSFLCVSFHYYIEHTWRSEKHLTILAITLRPIPLISAALWLETWLEQWHLASQDHK